MEKVSLAPTGNVPLLPTNTSETRTGLNEDTVHDICWIMTPRIKSNFETPNDSHPHWFIDDKLKHRIFEDTLAFILYIYKVVFFFLRWVRACETVSPWNPKKLPSTVWRGFYQCGQNTSFPVMLLLLCSLLQIMLIQTEAILIRRALPFISKSSVLVTFLHHRKRHTDPALLLSEALDITDEPWKG